MRTCQAHRIWNVEVEKKARLDKSSIKVLRAAYLVGVLIKISISLIQKFTE